MGKKDKRFVKYSIGLKESLPSSAKAFLEQSYISEDLALAEAINDNQELKGNRVVFDRGLQSRASFDKFTRDGKLFISRANPNIRLLNVEARPLTLKPPSATLTLITDRIGSLINKKEQSTECKYRIIEAVRNGTNEKINFVTNMLDEDAYLIAG